jgi:NAD(P)-dependent dehydrogenase (short-subunit alcohol dehydrogenase family)
VAAAALRAQLEVNTVAPILVTQAFLPALGMDRRRAGPPGRVVMMSSIYGSYGVPWMGPYAASKFALEGLTQSLRRELTPFGIDAVAIRPGPVSSDIWTASMHGGDAYWGAYDHTEYAAAMAKSRRYLERVAADPGWFLPCEAVGRAVWKALAAPPRTGPVTRVVTPNWFENWCAPIWLPARLVDRAVAAKFGLLRALGRAGEQCR